jgi:hypothetical protein
MMLAMMTLLQAADPTLPPANAHVKVTAVGLGVEVYQCAPQDGTYQWVLEMPVATLFDPTSHQAVGTHSVGPTWTWNDGSSITGKVIQNSPSSDPVNLPSLLIETHAAGTATGMLSDVTLVRRSETQAGMPTIGCDAEHQTNEVRVPYQATYTFYTTSK